VIENFWGNALYSVTPTILVGLVFWLVMRAIFRADRSERSMYSKIEAEERASAAAESATAETEPVNREV
jgi:flagellar biosynthesis/type III secretory pathway M-ring protein FliF/YscJ